MKSLTDDSLLARVLGWIARFVCRNQRFVIVSQLLLFIASILVTVKYPGIELNTSRDSLVGSNKKYHQNFMLFKKEFPQQDDLVVVVESEDAEKNRQFVERLGAKLEDARIMVPVSPGSTNTMETNLFSNVFYKGDLTMLGKKALLFVPEPDLVEMKKMLGEYGPFIRNFSRTTNLVSLFDMVNAQFRNAKREENAENKAMVNAFPALERIVAQANDSLRRPGTPPSPGVTALFNAGEEAEQQIYITFAQGRIYIVNAHA